MWGNERAMNTVQLPAHLVNNGDVIWYGNKEYPICNVVRLVNIVTLNYFLPDKNQSGYFNFEHDRLVEIVDKQNEFKVKTGYTMPPPPPQPGEHAVKPEVTPTIHFNNEVSPLFIPVPDEEDVLGKDVEVGDVIWVNDNWATVTNVYKHPHSPANKVNVDYGNIKGLQVRLALTGTFSRKVKAVMETLNIQLAIEAQQILLQKLEQMLDLTQLAPTEDGKIAIGNTSIRVDKAAVVKAARDEMKVAQSKVSELIKKL